MIAIIANLLLCRNPSEQPAQSENPQLSTGCCCCCCFLANSDLSPAISRLLTHMSLSFPCAGAAQFNKYGVFFLLAAVYFSVSPRLALQLVYPLLCLAARPGLLEAWLVLTSVKYHGNLYILIPLKPNQASNNRPQPFNASGWW